MIVELTDKLEHQMKDLQESMERLLQHSEERDKKVDEMYSLYTNGSAVITFLKYVFAGTVAVGGAYVVFKKILLGIY